MLSAVSMIVFSDALGGWWSSVGDFFLTHLGNRLLVSRSLRRNNSTQIVISCHLAEGFCHHRGCVKFMV